VQLSRLRYGQLLSKYESALSILEGVTEVTLLTLKYGLKKSLLRIQLDGRKIIVAPAQYTYTER